MKTAQGFFENEHIDLKDRKDRHPPIDGAPGWKNPHGTAS